MKENSLTVQNEAEVVSNGGYMYDKAKLSDLMDEVIASVKDSRLNTKRAISADIASTARVQSQYGQYITACERELRRKDLSDERRMELLDRIHDACEASENTGAESRAFQQEQLEGSRMLPLKVMGAIFTIIVGSCIGGAVYRVARV